MLFLYNIGIHYTHIMYYYKFMYTESFSIRFYLCTKFVDFKGNKKWLYEISFDNCMFVCLKSSLIHENYYFSYKLQIIKDIT
jgi:hypothetical protein